jgi:hypothetical protein
MLALDPNQTAEIKLTLDPARVFRVRFLTCRETLAYSVAHAAAIKETDEATSLQMFLDLLAPVVADPKDLADVLTPGEAWELAAKIPGAIMLAESDKKKSYLQSQSDGVKDANTTGQPASASTPPAPQAP